MAEKATIMGCSSLAMVLILFSMEHQVSQTKIKTFLKKVCWNKSGKSWVAALLNSKIFLEPKWNVCISSPQFCLADCEIIVRKKNIILILHHIFFSNMSPNSQKFRQWIDFDKGNKATLYRMKKLSQDYCSSFLCLPHSCWVKTKICFLCVWSKNVSGIYCLTTYCMKYNNSCDSFSPSSKA